MSRDRGIARDPERAFGPAPPALLALILLLDVLAVAFGSLIPLIPVESGADVWAALRTGLSLHVHAPVLATASERLFAFLPMGVLAGFLWNSMGRRRPVVAAAVLTVVVALALEIVQATDVARHPRLSDFLLAALFGCLGAAVVRPLQQAAHVTSASGRWRRAFGLRHGGPAIARQRSAAFRGLVFALVLCNAALVAILTIAHGGLRISAWNCSYPLLIGNESTRDLPWLGRIRGLAIYDRVPADAELRELSRLPMTAESSAARRRAGALLIYAFDAIDGTRIPNLGLANANGDLDGAIAGPPVGLTSDGALEIRDSFVIRTKATPEELCRRIATAEAFAIEVDMAGADVVQTGPARIVSMSQGPYERNFTLGQEGSALILRVRTARHGANGLRLPMRTGDHAVTGGWQRVWAAYSGGRAEISIDAAPALATAAGHELLVLDNKPVPVSQIAALLYSMAGAIAAVALAGRGWLRTLLLAYPLAAAVPLLYGLTLHAWYGYDLDRTFLAVAIVVPCLGLIAGAAIVRRFDRPIAGG